MNIMKTTGMEFIWNEGNKNDNAIKLFKENGIVFHYDKFFNLVADFYGIGLYFKVGYIKLHDNVFGVVIDY